MFQYAAARSLSLACGTELRLDVSDFSRRRMHQGFELHKVFGVGAPCADEVDIRRLLGWRGHAAIRPWLARPQLAPVRCARFVVEPHFQYWDGLGTDTSDVYLSGYWQSEKYFTSHRLQIREDFRFAAALDAVNARLAERIDATVAVSLHVRRGDYVSNRAARSTHGACTPGYYAEAMQRLAGQMPGLTFYVFSDDVEWARRHLPEAYDLVFVDHNRAAHSAVDMHLMSLCRHHVVANSSFSWWGAWLAGHPQQVVLAPRRWFVAPIDDSDLVPPTWLRV